MELLFHKSKNYCVSVYQAFSLSNGRHWTHPRGTSNQAEMSDNAYRPRRWNKSFPRQRVEALFRKSAQWPSAFEIPRCLAESRLSTCQI